MTKTELLPLEKQRAFADSPSNKSSNGRISHFNNWKIIYMSWVIAAIVTQIFHE